MATPNDPELQRLADAALKATESLATCVFGCVFPLLGAIAIGWYGWAEIGLGWFLTGLLGIGGLVGCFIVGVMLMSVFDRTDQAKARIVAETRQLFPPMQSGTGAVMARLRDLRDDERQRGEARDKQIEQGEKDAKGNVYEPLKRPYAALVDLLSAQPDYSEHFPSVDEQLSEQVDDAVGQLGGPAPLPTIGGGSQGAAGADESPTTNDPPTRMTTGTIPLELPPLDRPDDES